MVQCQAIRGMRVDNAECNRVGGCCLYQTFLDRLGTIIKPTSEARMRHAPQLPTHNCLNPTMHVGKMLVTASTLLIKPDAYKCHSPC